jgi:hypothetical protein
MERVIRVFQDCASADRADLEEWLALSGDERLRIGEELRQEAYPTDEPGLRRVLRVVEREVD